MKIMLKGIWLWILKHKTLSIVVTFIGFFGSIASILGWYKIDPPDIITNIKNFSITVNLNFIEFLLVAIGLSLFVIISFYYFTALLFKRSKKEKLSKAKAEINGLITQWENLEKRSHQLQVYSRATGKNPFEFESSIYPSPTTYRFVINRDHDFMIEYDRLKQLTQSKIENMCNDYPAIKSLFKRLGDLYIGYDFLSESEARTSAKTFFKNIMNLLGNIKEIIASV